MSKHTPGPWCVESASNGCFDIYRETNEGEAPPVACDCNEADARLIAAAPTMLAALRRAVIALAFASEQSAAMRDDYEAVSAAIASATGADHE